MFFFIYILYDIYFKKGFVDMTEGLNRAVMLKYFKMTGFIALLMLIYLVVQLVVSGALTIFYTMHLGLENKIDMDVSNVESLLLNNTGFIIFFSGLFALPIYLLLSIFRKESFVDASGFKKVRMKYIALSALMGVGASVVLTMALSFIPVDRWFPEYVETMDKMFGRGNLLSVIIGTGLTAPFIEEIIFRGFILKELEKNLPVTVAVVIQGILFGIFHFNMLQSIYAALLGVLLGFVFVWTRSIWAPIIVHMFINNTSTFLGKVLEEDFSGYYVVLALILGLIVTAFSIYTMWNERKKPEDVNVRFEK